jgi:hypothetical protein
MPQTLTQDVVVERLPRSQEGSAVPKIVATPWTDTTTTTTWSNTSFVFSNICVFFVVVWCCKESQALFFLFSFYNTNRQQVDLVRPDLVAKGLSPPTQADDDDECFFFSFCVRVGDT